MACSRRSPSPKRRRSPRASVTARRCRQRHQRLERRLQHLQGLEGASLGRRSAVDELSYQIVEVEVCEVCRWCGHRASLENNRTNHRRRGIVPPLSGERIARFTHDPIGLLRVGGPEE